MRVWGCMLSRIADDKRVLRLPGQSDPLAISKDLPRAARLDVLCIDGQLVTVLRLDDVLGADADVGGVEHDTLDRVRVTGRGLVLPIGNGQDAELLGADADSHAGRSVHTRGRGA